MYGVGVDMWAVGCILAELLLRVSLGLMYTLQYCNQYSYNLGKIIFPSIILEEEHHSYNKKPTSRPVKKKSHLPQCTFC